MIRAHLKKVYVVLFLLAIISVSVTGVVLISDAMDKNSAANYYNNIAAEDKLTITTNSESQSSDLKNLDVAACVSANKDYVGWIKSNNGCIDYPVVQGSDNLHYLKTRFDGEASAYGTIFVDSSCRLTSARNILLFGHSGGGTLMFSSLENYFTDANYISTYPTIEFSLMNDGKCSGYWDIFSVIRADISSQDKADKYYKSVTANDYADYLSFLKSQSIYDIDVPVSTEKRTVILSTCLPNHQYDYRLLVCAIERLQ